MAYLKRFSSILVVGVFAHTLFVPVAPQPAPVAPIAPVAPTVPTPPVVVPVPVAPTYPGRPQKLPITSPRLVVPISSVYAS